MSQSQSFIKICGLKDPLLAKKAVEMGAHFIGIMMHKPSKRYVSLQQAKQIATQVKAANGIPVGVFVDTSVNEINNIAATCGFTAVQLHGKARRNHQHLNPTLKRIYVATVNPDGSINIDEDDIQPLQKERDLLLFDNIEPGSGQLFEHENFSYTGDMPYLLAGGLTPNNVATVIKQIRPTGVDVSSGVESSPGKKSKELIEKFIVNAKEAFINE